MFITGAFSSSRGRRSATAGTLAALLAIWLLAPGCHGPQAPASGSDGSSRFDPTTGRFEFRLQSPTGAAMALQLVASGVLFDSRTHLVHAHVVIRNDGTETVPGPTGILVNAFHPSDVHPTNAPSWLCNGIPPDPETCPTWEFSYRGMFGDDGQLSPGETSLPVEWILLDATGSSFAFRAYLSRGPEISGVVFEDTNGDGRRQDEERGLVGAIVWLAHDRTRVTTQTDPVGDFSFVIAEPGLYEVGEVPSGECQPTTPPRQVLILRGSDGTLLGVRDVDFGCRPVAPPLGVPLDGFVFLDGNRDGHRDPTEPGVPGMHVFAETPHCPTLVPQEAVTDSNGHYQMRILPCEVPPLVVTLAIQPGTQVTSPNPFISDQAPRPGDVLHVDFGVVRGRPDSTCVLSEDQLVQGLAAAYRQRVFAKFSPLLSDDPGAQYVYLLNEPTPSGVTSWGVTEERRIERRMFSPESPFPGETPVPPELWIQRIDISLTAMTSWVEHADLYRSTANPQGLDPARWRATEATYRAHVFFQLAGATDYQIDARENFVVVEDRTKQVCDAGKFLLYRWEDLGASPARLATKDVGRRDSGVEQASWSQIKTLYE